MIRNLIVSAMFFLGSLVLAGDQSGIKSPEEMAAVIQRYLAAREWIKCDCATPRPACEAYCAPTKRTRWTCGTQAFRIEAEINAAMGAGAGPRQIVSMIENHPAPYSPIVVLTPKTPAKPKVDLKNIVVGNWQQVADQDNCVVWNSDPRPAEMLSWSGNCENGKAAGYGILVWQILKDNDYERFVYTGMMRNGKQHGDGILVFADGGRYEGGFHNGKESGAGVFITAKGKKSAADSSTFPPFNP